MKLHKYQVYRTAAIHPRSAQYERVREKRFPISYCLLTKRVCSFMLNVATGHRPDGNLGVVPPPEPAPGMRPSLERFLLTLALLLPAAGVDAQSWSRHYEGPFEYGSDWPSSITVDAAGDAIVLGWSQGTNGFVDGLAIKYSAAGTALSTNRYAGPASTNWSYAADIALDADGSVIATWGWSGGQPEQGALIIKYASTGGVLWTNRAPMSANASRIRATAIDEAKNVLITGRQQYEIVTTKFSPAGVPLWTNRYDAGGIHASSSVATDASGSVFVATTASEGFSTFKYATIKYSSAGVPLWTNYFREPAGIQTGTASLVALDQVGNVIVAGSTRMTDGSATTQNSSDIATIKYSNEGIPLWTNRFEGADAGWSYPWAVNFDANGDVVVTSVSARPWQSPGSPAGEAHAIVKYSSTGLPRWTNHFGQGEIYAVALDTTGDVYATGSVRGYGQIRDIATVRYSSSGVPIWTNVFDGPERGNDFAQAIAVDANHNVLVSGFSFEYEPGWSSITTIKYAATDFPAPPTIAIGRLGNALVLRWEPTGFRLQSAATLSGTFSDIPGATSPYTNLPSGPQRYFRLAK